MANNSNKKSTSKKSSTSSKKQTTPNYQKVAVKTVKKAAKKNPKAFLIVLLVLIVAVGIGLAVWLIIKSNNKSSNNSSSEPSSSESSSSSSSSEPVIVDDGISIHFLELGNYHTGDCTYIKAGDVDILIDAGSTNESVLTTKPFIDQYCTDGKLEYVIATHAHDDHISGFFNTTSRTGIFYSYQIGTLIDFPLTRKDGTKTTTTYGKYVRDRDARILSGDIEHHYNALQCINQEDGAQKEYTINESTTLTILDQVFYHEYDEEQKKEENNYSVCAMINHGSNHYLFTGDLEATGEASLVERNELPHCQLFKGGHHGSGTSNTDALLNVINPEVVCVCCCAGNYEYAARTNPEKTFPTQEAINRIAKHTDKIYVTTVTTDTYSGFTSMNGNILFKCDDGINYTVTGSNNSVILKETDWFRENRTWPTDGV